MSRAEPALAEKTGLAFGDSGHAGPRLRQGLVVAGKIALTAAALGLLARRIDITDVGRSLAAVSPAWIAATVACLSLSYLIGGVRWAIILRAMKRPVRLRTMIGAFWAGSAFAQVLPSPASDVARMWILSRRGVEMRDAAFSAICERLVMVVVLLAVVVLTLPLLPAVEGYRSAFLLAGGALTACIAAVAVLVFSRHMPWLSSGRGGRVLSALSDDARAVTRLPVLLPLVLSAAASHGNVVVAAALLGTGMGLHLPLLAYLAVIPVTVLAMVLPISFGGWGVREGVLVTLLGSLGRSGSDALAYSIALGVCLALSSLPGLLVLFGGGRDAPGRVDQGAP